MVKKAIVEGEKKAEQDMALLGSGSLLIDSNLRMFAEKIAGYERTSTRGCL